MMNYSLDRCRQAALSLVLFATLHFGFGGQLLNADEAGKNSMVERSRFVSEIHLPQERKAPLKDSGALLAFAIPPDMFDGARWDLADLRLLDAGGKEIPYALRVYSPRAERQDVAARSFNRVTANGTAEISLDLGEGPVDHNEVEVSTAGLGFRRAALLEGSDDGEDWKRLAETKLLRFSGARETFEEQRCAYSPSRYRYLRVRVERDPEVDKDAVEINFALVRRVVEIPGEFVTREATLGPREPSRQEGRTGSAWVIDLGGSQIPCRRLEVQIEGDEFVRDYVVTAHDEAAQHDGAWDTYPAYVAGYPYSAPPLPAVTSEGVPSLGASFHRFSAARGVWRRRAGEPASPLVAEFGDVRAGKLRLFVADSANEPLNVTSVKYVAPVCLAILADSAELAAPLRAYYGDVLAEPPNYDFSRNLPGRLDPPAARLEPGEREDNPAYVPPPPPFTERFRWLIHCVLGAVSLVLAGLVAQLARKVIARHDATARPREAAPT